MQEEWTRWHPLDDLEAKYDVETIIDNIEGLTVLLYSCNNKNKKVELIFKPYIESYRHTTESFRLKLPGELFMKYGDDFYGDWTFFKVADSEYLNWLAHESCDYSKEFALTHFCLLCSNSILDIIARHEPVVRHLSRP